MPTKIVEFAGAVDTDQNFSLATRYGAMTFVALTPFILTSVKLNLKKVGTPTGNYTVSIRATDIAGKPTGSNLVSKTAAAADLTTAYVLYEFITTAVQELTQGNKYAILITHPDYVSGLNYIVLGYHNDTTSDAYANGVWWYSDDSGSTWANASGEGSTVWRDVPFEAWGVSGWGNLWIEADYLRYIDPSAIEKPCAFELANTPTQIAANTNDWAVGQYSLVRASSDAARNLTGISGGVTAHQLILANVGSFTITLINQSASSTAANRFLNNTGADIALAADGIALLVYDATTARWRAALL